MILVTGATGNVGAAVAAELAARGVPFRALVRDAAKGAPLAALGAEVVVGDMDVPESLDVALAGVSRAFLLAPPSAVQHDREMSFIAAARRAGVGHIVKQSMLDADPLSPCRLMRSHAASEREIVVLGVPVTLLRANAFMENTLAFIPTIAAQHAVYSSIGEVKTSHVAVADIARVAAIALTERGHEGRSYDLTGPEALSFVDIAAILTETTGAPVEHVAISDDDALGALLGAGVDEWRARGLVELFEASRGGYGTQISGDVERVTGVPPQTYRQWAGQRAALFSGTAAAWAQAG